jgi:hypothetical protein
VHFDGKLACVFLYGERWRVAAAAGLRKLGIDRPREQEE